MRTMLKKSVQLFLILMIPAAIFTACQEDIHDPIRGGVPEPGEVVTPPKKKG